MAEPLRQAYDYWQDQPKWFSTEPASKKQAKAKKNNKRQPNTRVKKR